MAYPPFALTVDLVVFTLRPSETGSKLHVLLIKRGEPPFKGKWALPGGFVKIDEELKDAAYRELAEEANVTKTDVVLEQLRTYGTPDRDPRMRTVSVAWLAFGADLPEPTAGSDAAQANWVPISQIISGDIELAFDHHTILLDGLDRARAKLEYTTLATAFCPSPFTIAEIRAVYEAVWDTCIDPRNFHRKITGAHGFVEETGEKTTRGGGRPAALYQAGSATQLYPPILRG